MRRWWSIVTLLLLWWGTRIAALEALPLHNDEGLHLTRSVEVWNLHPFWEIGDGKIINHWPIALFYPQNAPVFVGRIATVLVCMTGLAAGYALVRRYFSERTALLAVVLWITCSYLFFYERLAFSDAEAGALVVLALWASLQLARSGRTRDAVLTGLALALAALFKFTAVPFAFMVALVVWLLSRAPWQRQLWHLVIIGVTVAVCFAIPLLYLLLRQGDFATALGWVGGSIRQTRALAANVGRLGSQLAGFGLPLWSALMLAGLVLLPFVKPRLGAILLLASGLPLLLMLVLGREVLSRHYVAALPLALVLASAGLGTAIERLKGARAQRLTSVLLSGGLALGFLPFMVTAYTSPGKLPLPLDVREQHITEHSAGFGLREAVLAFPQTITQRNLPIIASMFPDSCRRANFYAVHGIKLVCAAVPGLPEIEAAFERYGAVYVLADDTPRIGVDVTTVDAQATLIAAYPRPGETPESASVVLWRLER